MNFCTRLPSRFHPCRGCPSSRSRRCRRRRTCRASGRRRRSWRRRSSVSRRRMKIFCSWPSATKRKRCCGSFENAMSQTEPAPSVSGATTPSFTNLPFFSKTWMRLFVAVADVDHAVLADLDAAQVPELSSRAPCLHRWRPSAACRRPSSRRTRRRDDCRSRRRRRPRSPPHRAESTAVEPVVLALFAGVRLRCELPVSSLCRPPRASCSTSVAGARRHLTHAAAVAGAGRRRSARRPARASRLPAAGNRGGPRRDPDVALRVDGDARRRDAATRTCAGSAPVADEVARRDRTRAPAAPARSTSRRSSACRRADLGARGHRVEPRCTTQM